MSSLGRVFAILHLVCTEICTEDLCCCPTGTTQDRARGDRVAPMRDRARGGTDHEPEGPAARRQRIGAQLRGPAAAERPGRRSNPPEAPEGAVNKVDADCRDKEAEEQTQVRPLHLICEIGAHPGPREHAGRQNDGGVYVDVAVPVVLEGCGEANGRQEHRQARACGGVLREPGPVDESGHDDDAAPDSEQAGRDAAKNTDDPED